MGNSNNDEKPGFFKGIVRAIRKFINRLRGKSYIREGRCLGCGACCNMIILLTQGEPVQTEEEFEQLKEVFPEYGRFQIRGQRPAGQLLFTCRYLGKDNHCHDYDNRPLICRDYPNEDLLRKGGILVSTCGFRFIPVEDFQKVFEEALGEEIDGENVEPFIQNKAQEEILDRPEDNEEEKSNPQEKE